MALSYSVGTILNAIGQPVSGALTVTPNAASKVGDIIMVVVANADTSGSDFTMPAPWTRIMASASAGSGKLFTFTKPFEAGDTTYTITRNGADSYRIVPITISGADSGITPIIGTLGTRAASGGTTTTTAPSITTPGANYTALYIAMERTNAADSAPTINNGFNAVFDGHNDGVADGNPNAIFVAQKAIPVAGAVGATTATFTNAHATNSNAFLFGLAEKGSTGGGTGATVVAGATGRNNGSGTVTFGLPAGIAAGDLLLVATVIGSSGAPTTDSPAKGWWDFGRIAVNSRQWGIYGRIYNPSTPASDYTLTLQASAFARWVSVAVRGHGVTASTDIQFGTQWRRQDSGGSQGKILAPSITTPGTSRLVLAFTGEASNATGGYAVTNANGFSIVVDGTEDASAIEWATIWQKSLAAAGATGDMELTWAAASLNGIGVQMSIPPAADAPPPATGRIGHHAVTFYGDTTLGVGAKRFGGTAISVVLYNAAGTTEIERKTLTADTTTSWGNVQFFGLTPNTVYTVKFVVDGVTQLDVGIVRAKTRLPALVPASFVVTGGSCQFTSSNHPIYRAMAAKNPEVFVHMGDLHYADPTTAAAWRTAVDGSMSTPNFQYLLQRAPFYWTWDNHDRIILDAGASASPLNMGYTDPATNTQWRTYSGSGDQLATNAAGRAWLSGRVLFVQTDQWTNKDDPDAVAEPRTFLGSTQKQAFKDVLQIANDTPNIALVVWWSSWTTLNNGNGRWNSFPAETAELEAFIDARPALKKKMVLIGGDSHSLQADSGTRSGTQYRFKGIPSLNVSGFNRDSTSGDGSAGWDIANNSLITVGTPEQGWGGYSLLTITDNGKELRFRWEARRVHDDQNNNYTEDTVAFFERSYGTDIQNAYMGTTKAKSVHMGGTRLWSREDKGSDYTPSSTA